MFYNYLKNGGKIRVESDGKHNIHDYPATFTMENGEVFYFNEALGKGKHDLFTEHPMCFDAHIEIMLSENYRVVMQKA